VTWPGNKVERFEGDFRAGSTVLLRRGAGRAEGLKLTAARLPDPLTRDQMFARGLKVAVGQPLPELLVKTPEGETVPLHQRLQTGRRMIVNVRATWCLPCRREMPELEKLRAGLAASKVDFVGLNVDSDPKADVRGFLRDYRVGYPIYLGGVPSIERLYATDELSVPMSILIDDRGVVQEIFPGWSERTQKRFNALSGGRE
jgi:thiol-disulfide isomerase/thioredoxin